ncbi:hypothetical protein COCSADRAFT_338195 [Bipolaris sorokiniana ND90Pr]|uniref:Uncharacterized protein n=1 Tax=Cochliobolus sativus (strain ND90Pr / ATCC 201652) TaxID=665912 RepID=M2S7Q7_COCSN|nr:uncharacterized protein COCSADRAFT_338195 [Bipolaris sorokiniana ND90Pr]EMD63148.1 hypothetical protein COCSADRAFT_338195 [Bipolaris sorokiniana ND90Pr]
MFCTYLDSHTHAHVHMFSKYTTPSQRRCPSPSRRLGRAQTRALPWFSLAVCRCFTLHTWQDTRRAFSAEQNAEALDSMLADKFSPAARHACPAVTAKRGNRNEQMRRGLLPPCIFLSLAAGCWLQRRSREPHVLFHHQPCHGSGTPDTTLVANPTPCSPLEIAHRAQPNPRNH